MNLPMVYSMIMNYLFIYVVTVDYFSKFSLLKIFEQFFKTEDQKRKTKRELKNLLKLLTTQYCTLSIYILV